MDENISFDPLEATIESVQSAIFSGRSTCHDIVLSYLTRIHAVNPSINAIICLNPKALDEAKALDDVLASGEPAGSLFGVPILLKDNFNTTSMKTTGGCLGLKTLQPSADAKVVKALKEAGAIVLGKTNLHEMALEGLSVSSLGGQTRNPYDLTRTPGGSSGGSGAAVAASLCVFATGTDTVNSLRSPASANSLFSCRPTRGLISRDGIIPISFTQDVAGPIARCVKDLTIALTVMASVGIDHDDTATLARPDYTMNIDYAAGLDQRNISGLRIGVLEGFRSKVESAETSPVNGAINEAIRHLESAGAKVVRIDDAVYDAANILATLDTQRFEYRENLDRYLRRKDVQGEHPRDFHSLYSSSKFLVIQGQHEYIETASRIDTTNAHYKVVLKGIASLTQTLNDTFDRLELDAIIYPQQKCLTVKIGSPSQAQRNGILAALTGFPSVCVPAGYSPGTADAPIGVPIGMEMLGKPWSEKKLLQIAYLFESGTRVRRPPMLAAVKAESVVELPMDWADLRPDSKTHEAYPQGVLS